MSDSLSNKELVAVGHQFVKTLSSDTPFIDMAKIVSRLAERLDCIAAALRATQAQRDALGAENAALNKFIDDHCYVYGLHDVEPVDAAIEKPQTPATTAFLAEVRGQGVDLAAESDQFLGLEADPHARPAEPAGQGYHGVRSVCLILIFIFRGGETSHNVKISVNNSCLIS